MKARKIIDGYKKIMAFDITWIKSSIILQKSDFVLVRIRITIKQNGCTPSLLLMLIIMWETTLFRVIDETLDKKSTRIWKREYVGIQRGMTAKGKNHPFSTNKKGNPNK